MSNITLIIFFLVLVGTTEIVRIEIDHFRGLKQFTFIGLSTPTLIP